MCGLAGILGDVRPDDGATVGRMLDVQAYRGPDAGRVLTLPGAVLGHRRLSIIDLSDRGLQPMSSSDGRFVLTYNGEIYNYRELRAELAGRYPFRTETDSEVLLAAWAAWGERCLDRMNGMFAFCIFDRHARVAFLARDRFGQKPLFLHQSGRRLLFASEAKGLFAAGVERAPDLSVWSRYLLTANYDDTAATYFANVTQLLPGECATFGPDAGLVRRQWYRLSDRVHERRIDVEAATAATRDLIVDACRIHMRADVPVAILLSGGLDSSAMLAGLDLASVLGPEVKCFAVDFGPDLSERPWIEDAANHHRLRCSIDTFTQKMFCDTLGQMMWHLEGPIGGLMNSALAMPIAHAQREGFRVVLDGTGPDEIFAGYRNHHNLYVGLLLQSQSGAAEQAVAEYARNWGVDASAARLAATRELDRENTAIDGSVPVRPDLLSPQAVRRELAQPPISGSTGDRLRDALVSYVQGSKIGRNMRMKDRLSMAYAVELRLPYLDHRLAEHGLSLPTAQYFLDGYSKSIVRRAMSGSMNDGVRVATKRSIQAPQGIWLRNEPMRAYVRSLIESESFASRGLFDVPRVRAAYDAFCTGGADSSFFVWQWINVEVWFRTFVDADPVKDRHPLANHLTTQAATSVADAREFRAGYLH